MDRRERMARSIEHFLNGDPLDLVLDVTLSEALPLIFSGLMLAGKYELTIDYFSSQGAKMYDVQDQLVYDGTSDMLHVHHYPVDEDGLSVHMKFKVTPGEYVERMKFMDSISSVEIDFFSEREPTSLWGKLSVNFERRVVSPMERVNLPGGSYLTLTTLVQELRISYTT
jgi:hypothetical protein